MGIYDRDYIRDEYEQQRRGSSLAAPQSMTIALIIVNVALFLLNYIFSPPDKNNPHDMGSLTTLLSASSETLLRPWLWWQFLTAGFAHASLQHILFNMLQLYFLGKYVEDLYGKWEFLRIYVAMVLFGSVVWALGEVLFPSPPPGARMLGASGAVCGVVMLFILNYPDVKLVLFPIPIPMKAWVMGILLIVMNVGLALVPTIYGGHIAWSVHLAGIAFAYLYFRGHWNLGGLFHALAQKPKFISRPNLRLLKPEVDDSEPLDLNDEVDRILDKINQQGEKSLTKQERRLLEIASRKYQKRKNE